MVNGRNKGAAYEREIARKLRHIYPKARRKLEYNEMDANGVDLQDTGPFRFQLKRGRNYAPINKIEEIQVGDGIHALITKGDKKRDVVCLYLEDFLKIIEDIGEAYV